MIVILDCTGIISRTISEQLGIANKSYNAITSKLNRVDIGKSLVPIHELYRALNLELSDDSDDITIYSGTPFSSNSHTTSVMTSSFISVIDPDIIIGEYLFNNSCCKIDDMNRIVVSANDQGVLQIVCVDNFNSGHSNFAVYLNKKQIHNETYNSASFNEREQQKFTSIMCVIKNYVDAKMFVNREPVVSERPSVNVVELKSELELCKRNLIMKNEEIKLLKVKIAEYEALMGSVRLLIDRK